MEISPFRYDEFAFALFAKLQIFFHVSIKFSSIHKLHVESDLVFHMLALLEQDLNP